MDQVCDIAQREKLGAAEYAIAVCCRQTPVVLVTPGESFTADKAAIAELFAGLALCERCELQMYSLLYRHHRLRQIKEVGAPSSAPQGGTPAGGT